MSPPPIFPAFLLGVAQSFMESKPASLGFQVKKLRQVVPLPQLNKFLCAVWQCFYGNTYLCPEHCARHLREN